MSASDRVVEDSLEVFLEAEERQEYRQANLRVTQRASLASVVAVLVATFALSDLSQIWFGLPFAAAYIVVEYGMRRSRPGWLWTFISGCLFLGGTLWFVWVHLPGFLDRL